MQCYTELTPPTAVSHTLSVPFVSANAQNLIVAKTSLLQIFSVKLVPEEFDITAKEGGKVEDSLDDENGEQPALPKSQRATSAKLVLVAEYSLSGTITSMVAVRILKSKSGGHALLLGFRDAKLSLLEWDPERNGISTLSIHYFEQDELGGSPWAPDLSDSVNYLTADPASRCAALKFGVRSLAILPFNQGDDDTAMDDWDEELDGPRPSTTATALTNGQSQPEESPYGSSFVLCLSSLDPSLIFPIDLAFLYEYREPTFGILSSKISPSASLLHERKDYLSYMVFTLDLHQKASTTILAVHGLPYDLYKIVALPTPIGGALVVGSNELIHIDQSGKTNGVAVNIFARQSTAFGLADQSDLNLRLEGCFIEQLSIESGEMLLVVNTGELCILSFRMDGRSVSGITLRLIDGDHGGRSLSSEMSSISLVGPQTVFIGSECCDSVILGWTRKSSHTNKRRSQVDQSNGINDMDLEMEDDVEDDDEDDDDDLYGEATIKAAIPGMKQVRKNDTNSRAGDYVFRIHDNLLNIAPLHDVSLGRPSPLSDALITSDAGDLQIIAASGSRSLIALKREVESDVIGEFEFEETRGLWTVSVKKPIPKALQEDKRGAAINGTGTQSLDVQFDRLMIVSKASLSVGEEAEETSDVYALTAAGFETLTGTEFEPAAGATVEVGTLGQNTRLIQVLRSEVRCYDGDLGLAQILPMFDEETEAEPKIVSASMADPYLLLLRDDASIMVVQCDSSNELEEIEREDDGLLTNEWLSGCLYKDTDGAFTQSGKATGEVVLFLLSTKGALFLYALPDLTKPIYKAEGISYLPTTIAPHYVPRRSSAAREMLTEILVADLGDKTARSPFVILRSSSDDLTIYEPFLAYEGPLSSALHFNKVRNPYLAKNPEVAALEAESEYGDRLNPMRAIANLRGFSTVFLPGGSPCFIFKSAKSTPKVVGLRGAGVRGFSGFHTAGCDRGFIYVDTTGTARVSQLPAGINYELGLPMRRIKFDADITAVAYHPPSDTYVIASSVFDPFELPKDDDYHREWAKEETTFTPLIERTIINLVNPKTWSVIDSVDCESGEVAMCLKTLNLEVSEETHENKQLITIGTAIRKGEDLAIKGSVYVYDIVTVVPSPKRLETNKKLKLIAKEAIPRGAVTGISEIGSQGFMIIAQGQKCMVRGLKEDGTLLPVAFLDMNTYVTSIKELPGTGLCAVGDALKGMWLIGYTEEPYKLMLFGKQTVDMEIGVVDFLPVGEGLYLLAADSDCNLHVLQFDPEHPKSLHGQHLLHRTTFSLGGHMPTTMTLLPSTSPTTTLPSTTSQESLESRTNPSSTLLLTTLTGSIALLQPLTEEKYRRLSTLSSLLSNTLYHPAGLNPKMYRVCKRAPESVVGGRNVLDGNLLERYWELGVQKRGEVAGRVGGGGDAVREDLEGLRGSLDFL